MKPETFELEGASLEEARNHAKEKVPVGQRIVSEEILCNGKTDTIRGVKKTVQAAFEDVYKQVPAGAVIINEEIRIQPRDYILPIEAYDEQSARTCAQSKIDQTALVIDPTALIKNIKIEKLGVKGFLGIGKSPNLYHVGVSQPAVVEVAFVSVKARIRVKTGPVPSITQLLESLKGLMRTTSENGSLIERIPVKGDLESVMLLTVVFNLLKEKVSVPFNSILADAKCLFPGDSAIQNIQMLNLGPPNRAFDVYDIPLVAEQSKEALTAIKYTIELLEQKSKDM